MKTASELSDRHQAFITEQQMFFVGSAPNFGHTPQGHVNLSPKGLDGTFAVIDRTTIAYLDLVGSGVETIAHLKDNGRLCIMFCAFAGKPNILRLHGTGRAVEPKDVGFQELLKQFDHQSAGIRSVICLDIERIADSCGFGVPLYEYTGQRDILTKWIDKNGEEGVHQYQLKNNTQSIDGLTGVELHH